MSEDLFSKALEEPNMEVHLPTLNDDVIADELSNDEALVVNPETNSTEENTSVEKIAEENTSEEGQTTLHHLLEVIPKAIPMILVLPTMLKMEEKTMGMQTVILKKMIPTTALLSPNMKS